MIINKKGTTIVESIIVMMIITIGILGAYDVYSMSQKLANSSANKIQAISIAREGIEAMTNIRDTNWLLYSANTTNCWNTYNYSGSCITSNVDIASGSYIIYKNTSDRWTLSGITINGNYLSGTYKNDFKVNLDNNGFYTQSGGTNFSPIFTREIKVSYPSDAGIPPQKMNVESIVKWSDSSINNGNYQVVFKTLLTNWKK